jgi:hypothetical protein
MGNDVICLLRKPERMVPARTPHIAKNILTTVIHTAEMPYSQVNRAAFALEKNAHLA